MQHFKNAGVLECFAARVFSEAVHRTKEIFLPTECSGITVEVCKVSTVRKQDMTG